MAELNPEVEQQLADLNDDDWHALIARVRPPGWHGATKPGEQARQQLEKRFGNRSQK